MMTWWISLGLIAAGIVIVAVFLGWTLFGLDELWRQREERRHGGHWLMSDAVLPEEVRARRRVFWRLIAGIAVAAIFFAIAVSLPEGLSKKPEQLSSTVAELRAALNCEGASPPSICTRLKAMDARLDALRDAVASRPNDGISISTGGLPSDGVGLGKGAAQTPLTAADLHAALNCEGANPSSLCTRLDAMRTQLDKIGSKFIQVKPNSSGYSWLFFIAALALAGGLAFALYKNALEPTPFQRAIAYGTLGVAAVGALSNLLGGVATFYSAVLKPTPNPVRSTVNFFQPGPTGQYDGSRPVQSALHLPTIPIFFPEGKLKMFQKGYHGFPSEDVWLIRELVGGLRACGGNGAHPVKLTVIGFASSTEFKGYKDSDTNNLHIANLRAKWVGDELLAVAGTIGKGAQWLQVAPVHWGPDQFAAMEGERPYDDRPGGVPGSRDQEILDRVAFIQVADSARCAGTLETGGN